MNEIYLLLKSFVLKYYVMENSITWAGQVGDFKFPQVKGNDKKKQKSGRGKKFKCVTTQAGLVGQAWSIMCEFFIVLPLGANQNSNHIFHQCFDLATPKATTQIQMKYDCEIEFL